MCYPTLAVAPIGILGGMPGGGEDLVVGHSGAAAFPDARLAGWSGWFVTASFASGGKEMLVSYGHGSPFVYATFRGGDPMFPFLRCFDCYAGHSWASGHARFADGNNQESSSEAMNAWAALILSGEAVGDRRLRELGIWLYTTEMEAINAYWFDVTGTLRAPAYRAPVLAMVWGGKGVRETWFSAKPEMVYGINWLPFRGGSLYLGLYPDYVQRCYDGLIAAKGGKPVEDRADLVLMYRALANPKAALRQLKGRGGNVPIEAGNSRANLLHWLHALGALGRLDRTVTADYPVYAVFRGDQVVVSLGEEREGVVTQTFRRAPFLLEAPW